MKRLACIIVGGGPAGISTALFLSGAAPHLRDRIVVLEKEKYPREKFCAGAIGARADALLASIGVRVDVPSVPIDGLALATAEGSVVAREPGAGRVVRRIQFDHALAEEARARGIHVRDGVRALTMKAGTREVVVETSAGVLRADAVVGADGVGSLVRRALGVPRAPYTAQALEVDTEPVPTDPDRSTLVFDVSRRDIAGYTWHFPTLVAGRPLVSRGVYALRREDAPPGTPDIQDVLDAELRRLGLSLASYEKKRYAERGYSAGARMSARRVLLVGEASGIDPVTGEGIAQAVQYGAAAGEYLAKKLSRGDVFFDDFPAHVARSSVGRDLLVRSSVVELAYGRHRPTVERFLVATPEFLEVGLQHFAGHRWSTRAMLRAFPRAAMAALTAKWSGS